MDFVQMCIILVLFIFGLLFLDFVWGLCLAAGKPVPSVFDRLVDYSDGACTNCPDLDTCEDDECPHDWMDWGVE